MPDAALPPVVVLCGGLGTRLRAVLQDRPKALAPVGGVPFLSLLLGSLARQGAGRVVLAAGYLGEHLRVYAEAQAPDGLDVRVVEEPHPLGTAGALRFAQAEAGLAGPFLAANGDTLFTGSVRRLAEAHAAGGDARRATVALVPPPGGARFGRVTLGRDGRVTAFAEKDGQAGGWTNAGLYAIAPDALAHIRPGDAASLELDVLPGLVGRGLGGLTFPDATFLDIGTPESLAAAAGFVHALPSPP